MPRMTLMSERPGRSANSRAKWLFLYKASVFALVTWLVWGISPLIAKAMFETTFPQLLPRIWFTLMWGAGLASLFDMKASLAKAWANFPVPRSFYFVWFFASTVCAIVMLIESSLAIQMWFRLELVPSVLISAIWSILVFSIMLKATLDVSRERQNDAAN